MGKDASTLLKPCLVELGEKWGCRTSKSLVGSKDQQPWLGLIQKNILEFYEGTFQDFFQKLMLGKQFPLAKKQSELLIFSPWLCLFGHFLWVRGRLCGNVGNSHQRCSDNFTFCNVTRLQKLIIEQKYTNWINKKHKCKKNFLRGD